MTPTHLDLTLMITHPLSRPFAKLWTLLGFIIASAGQRSRPQQRQKNLQVAPAPKHPSTLLAGGKPVAHDGDPVDEDVRHAFGVAIWVLIRRHICDAQRIEG